MSMGHGAAGKARYKYNTPHHNLEGTNLLEMAARGSRNRNVDFTLHAYHDGNSPYAAPSDSSRSPNTYDRAGSENGSLYESMPGSPLINGSLPATCQSPSSTSSYPSPKHAEHAVSPSSAGNALLSTSSGLDGEQDSSSQWKSTEDRQAKLKSGRDYPVCCLYPQCTAKPFKRRADLDRHYKHRHASNAQKVSFSCDYPRCSRRRDPFHRLDHFRDHLREYHKEDIEKRGGSADAEWFEARRVSQTWWRCSKCLKRISIETNGYECPGCKIACPGRRKEARRRS